MSLTRRVRLQPMGRGARKTATGLGLLLILRGLAGMACAQSPTFAGNAQHTAVFATPAQRLGTLRWSTSVDLNNNGGMAHYGAPLITGSNTVIVPVRTTNGFSLSAYEGASGRLKYTLATDYRLPSHNWVPAYQPVLAAHGDGLRFYFPGAGGTVYYVDDPDSDMPGTAAQICFYASLTNYHANASAFTNRVFVNTPLTADANGVIFFGFWVATNGAPAPLNTTNGGFARIDLVGNTSFVLAGEAADDPLITRCSHNCAPALSYDGSTLYVAVKGATSAYYAYLLGLDSTTLATKYKVKLRDPRNGNHAGVPDDGTASPMIAPDGDVYLGVFANPNNASRGFLLRFNADLSVQKLPGGFGWDNTPAVVPTNMVAGYAGTSPYLLFSKYNNYAASGDSDGINRLALLDPNAAQIDPHPTAAGLLEMREVLTVIGCTPDASHIGSTYPYAVREWCLNTAAVNPATTSIFAPCEDGRIYRWNLASNSLTESFRLRSGVFEPYVPTVIGPDGMVYTLNGGTLFAVGDQTNVSVAVYSSLPDLRAGVAGEAVTFTAVVSSPDGSGLLPTGTMTFQAVTHEGSAPRTNLLALNVPLTNGMTAITTSALPAVSNYLGSHFITATYSGDANYPSGSATLVQKIHARGTNTRLDSAEPAPGSNTVSFTALVTSEPPGGGTPTGMVTFWDGAALLAQLPLKANGMATLSVSNLGIGSHAIRASYASDTVFAASTGILLGTAPVLRSVARLGNGDVRLAFTNVCGAPFTVLENTNPALPMNLWRELGTAIEIAPGQFQFTDNSLTSRSTRFYRVRSP